MTPTERFAVLVAGEGLEHRLDEAALVIAAHARPDGDPLDVEAYLARVDGLAAGAKEASATAVLEHLFAVEGFRGDTESYYDPRNSYLDEVLDRRLGIPISLSLLVVEVGRRLGVPFEPIGMPGHFLVRCDGQLYDPFERGRALSVAECAMRFEAIHGGGAPFTEDLLAVATPVDIVARMLNNLRQVHLAAKDSTNLEWVLRLRSLLPGTTLEERVERAGVLAALGRFDEAADLLESLAPAAGERSQVLLGKSRQLRARLN